MPVVVALAGRVSADSVRVTGPTDYWFHYTEQRVFSARTFSVDGHWSDPMLWLFTADGVLLAQNDDWYGLQSRLEVPLQPGSYRLRAGVCCGNPDQWWQGVQYDLWTADVAVAATSTTVESTTTEPSTTTTVQTTTTEVASTTTSVDVTTTTVEPSTTSTSVVQPTTTESSTTTSTVPVPTTTVPPETVPDTTAQLETTTTSTPNTTTTVSVVTTTTSVPPVPTATTTTTVPPLPTVTTTTTTTTTTLPVTTTTFSRAVEPIVEPEQIAELVDELDTLTEEELVTVVAALNEAPTEIRKQFETQVNVYSGKFDSYVPAGSKVPVSERRVLVAFAGTALASAGAVRRKM